MKIIMDKVTVYPPHAFCRSDVRLILSSVPAKWSELVAVVRLSASQESHVARYNRFDKLFTIASRGWPKEDALRLVLGELAAHALGFKQRMFGRMPARYQSQVEHMVAPLVEDLLPKLSQKKIWLDK